MLSAEITRSKLEGIGSPKVRVRWRQERSDISEAGFASVRSYRRANSNLYATPKSGSKRTRQGFFPIDECAEQVGPVTHEACGHTALQVFERYT